MNYSFARNEIYDFSTIKAMMKFLQLGRVDIDIVIKKNAYLLPLIDNAIREMKESGVKFKLRTEIG